MSKTVTNTTKHHGIGDVLSMGIMGGDGRAIEAMEAEGTRQLAQAEVIPRDLGYQGSEQVLTALGFVLGDGVPDDPVFRFAKLPPGWRWKRTDHSMWLELVDAKGSRRGMCFYKAAFYDRSAHLSLSSRFELRQEYGEDLTPIVVGILDNETGELLHSQPAPTDDQANYELRKKLQEKFQGLAECDSPTAWWGDDRAQLALAEVMGRVSA